MAEAWGGLGVAVGRRWAMIDTGMVTLVAAVTFWLARGAMRRDAVS